MAYWVYILASPNNTTVYTGVTNNLCRRMYEHKNDVHPDSFTARYYVHKLVYYEETSDARSAIEREKQIKSWSRAKKNALVDSVNPQWQDLHCKILP